MESAYVLFRGRVLPVMRSHFSGYAISFGMGSEPSIPLREEGFFVPSVRREERQ